MKWSDAEKDLLRDQWDAGLTAGSIAKNLPGRSRNAILGQAHRLYLATRVSPVAVPENATRPENWATDRCQWIDGKPKEQTFCGMKTDGGSWCDQHRKRVFDNTKNEAAK